MSKLMTVNQANADRKKKWTITAGGWTEIRISTKCVFEKREKIPCFT